jgi:Fe2+ or Zn2+ uptake regulation protein
LAQFNDGKQIAAQSPTHTGREAFVMVKTKQREVIFAAVTAGRTHPTADELFLQVRKELPNISLATVYRNLNHMAGQGKLRKLEIPGQPDRFDWDMTPHDHIICEKCGRIFDFALPTSLQEEICQASGMQVTRYEVIAQGICSACSGES